MVLSGIAVLTAGLNAPVNAEDELLTGDKRTACEVLLCLSSGKRPHECEAPLRRYFSIKHKKASDTRKARKNFLKLCPSSNSGGNMGTLVNAIVDGAGNCDAQSLNRNLQYQINLGNETYVTAIRNKMPGYCVSYFNHGYTAFDDTPMYVGTPKMKGYWVEASKYEAALAEYNAWLEAELKRQEEEQRIKDEQAGGY